MLNAAFTHEETQYVYIFTPANNSVMRHVIETMGFQYQESYCWERRFGHERTWVTHFIPQSEIADSDNK